MLMPTWGFTYRYLSRRLDSNQHNLFFPKSVYTEVTLIYSIHLKQQRIKSNLNFTTPRIIVAPTGFEPVIPAWETDDLNQSVPRAIYKAVIPISSNLIICLSDDPDLCELLSTNNSLYVERLMGVEPTSLAWKASIINRYTTAASNVISLLHNKNNSCNILEKCFMDSNHHLGLCRPAL